MFGDSRSKAELCGLYFNKNNMNPEQENPDEEQTLLNANSIETEEEDDDEALSQGVFEWYQYKADPKQEPVRVDKFLMDRMEGVTRSRLQRGIDEGWVLVNDRPVKSNHKIKPGDRLSVRWKKPRYAQKPQAEAIPLDIRYEDEDVLVIFKPAGMIVHPGVGNPSGTVVNALMHHLIQLRSERLEELDDERPGIVHRIDKNTTGLLVLCKTGTATSRLAKQFYDRTIERRYMALVWGSLDEDQGTIRGNIGRHPRHRQLFTVLPDDDPSGKHAVTHYTVLRRYGYVTLVECKLETGRTHQIRVHFQHIGHPLFNDPEYGGDRIVKGTIFSKYKQFVENCFRIMPYHCLHAFSLGFEHPTTGQPIYLEAAPPENFRQLLDKWEHYTVGRLK